MHVNLIPTNEYYHRIIEAPDAATREQIYVELLVAPWQQMMGTMLGPDDAGDPLAGARAWAWLLPDDLAHVPAATFLPADEIVRESGFFAA